MGAMRNGWIHKASLAIGLIVGLLLGGCDSGGRAPEPAPAPPGAPLQPSAAPAAAAPGAPAAPGVASGEQADQGEVVARYGSEVLTETELVTELSRLPSRSRSVMNPEGRRRFVENYVLNELIFQEGTSRGYLEDADIVQQVNDLRKRLVVQKVVRDLQDLAPLTDEEVQKQYDAHPERYSTTTIRARHILVKDEAEAKKLREQAVAKPDSFADLAKEHSIDKASARKGGDLGFFGHGRMVPEFEEVAFSLKSNGEISEIVRTQYGFHIIQLEERREGKPKPFDQVKDQIKSVMRNTQLRERTEQHYEELKAKANVQIDDAAAERAAAKVPEPSPGAGSFHGMGH
jgi:peptidyl-prolyl cis-trans isomerase C